MNSTTPENLYLAVSQVAKRFGISVDTVWRWTRDDEFPGPWKMGPNTTRRKLSDIHEFEAKLTTYFVEAAFDLAGFMSRLAA